MTGSGHGRGSRMSETSAIILAGGTSRRLGPNKALIPLAGRPLILHVLDRISPVVDETVVVGSADQHDALRGLLGCGARVITDGPGPRSPLAGALSGFEAARGGLSLLLPCDAPFVSGEVAVFLLDACFRRDAVIPRWPNGYIEPLQAVYRTRPAAEAARKALEGGGLDMRSMIGRLGRVRYVSTGVLRAIDPDLRTFFNVNTPEDLRRAESLL